MVGQPWAADLARRVLAYEAAGRTDSEGLIEAADRACKRITAVVRSYTGPAATRALLGHALRRAIAQIPFLTGVTPTVTEEGGLDWLRGHVQGQDPALVSEALVAICTEYLMTLATTFGITLAEESAREAWPQL